jgi:mannose-6-phosphate isomerase-like protein (cupin superfamily)
MKTFDLAETYVHLEDGPDATAVTVGPDFWEQRGVGTPLHDGRLVMIFRFARPEDWNHWEMHPAGDEIVFLLSGELDLVVEEDGRERAIPLRDRGACIVPRGVWHRAIIRAPGETLHVTRGAGTETRAI